MKKILSLVLVAMLAVASLDAEAARRLGGGKSIGQQSSNVTQREAVKAPTAPTTATQATSQTVQPATAATGAGGAAAPAARKPWGAMLGGLAAGLGLAWLAHSLGLGEAFGQFLLMGLLALVVMAVIGAVLRARKAPQRTEGGLALQGAGGAPTVATLPRQYSPDKVGNDASARPWESNATGFDAGSSGTMIGSALAGAQTWGIPQGFDAAGFLGAAKRNFVTLQDAWDRSDIATLRSMMTDTMVAEIRTQLAERESHAPGQPNKTEVVMLEAQLLGIEELPDHYMASVEFNGMIREEPSAGPSPFREVWNMTKPRSGNSGWLVAGVQALQ